MMIPRVLILLSFVSFVTCHRIAVIGGGISGTFVSKYLVEYDKDGTIDEIAIFDPLPLGELTAVSDISSEDWQGSRVAAVRMEDDSVVEIGASVFYAGFHLIMDMINGDTADNLEIGSAYNTGSSPDLDPNSRTGMGVYDGLGDYRFFTANDPKMWSLAKMAWRYNMDLYRVFSATSKVEFAFSIANQLLHSEHETTFFDNAAEMWEAVGLAKAAHNTFDDFLDALGVCQSKDDLSWFRRNVLPNQGCIREELLAAVTLCNYNQGPSDVNGLVGLGSFVAAKVKLLSIVGGNQKIIASAFRQTQAQLLAREMEQRNDKKGAPTVVKHVQQRVTTVISSLETMELFSEESSLGEYDVVILAAPLHVSRVNFVVQSEKDAAILQPMPFEMINVEHHKPEDGEHPTMATPLPDYATRPYTQVVTTLVSGGVINASYFHLSSNEGALPRSILMTEHGKALEHNITAIAQMTTTSGAYKVFSSSTLPSSLLATLFGQNHKVVLVKVWGGPHGGATPDYQGYGRTVDYLLYDAGHGIKGHSEGTALYYPNAIETSMACMELSAIGAKSVAKLVAKRLGFLIPHNGTKVGTDEL